jgi:hypothetical protein
VDAQSDLLTNRQVGAEAGLLGFERKLTRRSEENVFILTQGTEVVRPARGGRLWIRLRLEWIAAERHRRRRRQWRICVRQPGCTGGNEKRKSLEHHQFSAENAEKKGGFKGNLTKSEVEAGSGGSIGALASS